VHLIRPMTTTHSLDTEQRLVELRFHQRDGCRLSVEAPTEATLAPPGWYMPFIVDHHGVPSVAKSVQLTARFSCATTSREAVPGKCIYSSGQVASAYELPRPPASEDFNATMAACETPARIT
jgi:hypothetical protein